MKKSFDEILSECIRELESSSADIETVVSRHPEHAEELRNHLRVWASLSAATEDADPQGAMRGRQQLLTAVGSSKRPDESRGFLRGPASRGGLTSMRYAFAVVAGAALALGVTFLTGSLDFGSSSGSIEAQQLPECVLQLDFNGDGQLGVEDILVFADAIENNDPAFDYNGDTVTDINDAVVVVQAVVDCFGNIQIPLP